MDDNALGAVFEELEGIDAKEKNIISSFEKRISSLYEHKKKARSLILALSGIKSSWVSTDYKRGIASLIIEISDLLRRNFVSLDIEGYSGEIARIEQQEMLLLSKDIAKNNEFQNSLASSRNKKMSELVLKDLQSELLLDKEMNSLHEKFSERIRFFRIYYTQQKRNVENELKLLDEMSNWLKESHEYNPNLINSWCDSLKFYEEQIEAYLQKEKEDFHRPLDYLFERTRRSRDLSAKLFQKYWGDSLIKRVYHYFKPDPIIQAIKQDVQTFSSPEEFGEYKNKLNELFRYGFPRNKKIQRFLHLLEASRTIAEKEKTYAKNSLDVIASIDALTELPNRRRFIDLFMNEMNRTIRMNENAGGKKHYLSLLMLDIDHFKTYNDGFSHKAGDIVLKSFSGIVRKNIRSSDVLARWGGEEFIILLPETDKEQAYHVAEMIRKRVMEDSVSVMSEIKKAFQIMKGDINSFKDFKVSIGVSTYPTDMTGVGNDYKRMSDLFEELQHKADLQLYEAKKERNCVRPTL